MSAGSPAARGAARFVAGAVAVLGVHQAAVWALHRAGVTPWPAYALEPTPPLGVPRVLSAAFWGGAWWVALAPVAERAMGGRYWARAAALGAVPPTVVGALLTVAGRSGPRPAASPVVLLVAALGVNALWGLAAAALRRPRRTPHRRRHASAHPAPATR